MFHWDELNRAWRENMQKDREIARLENANDTLTYEVEELNQVVEEKEEELNELRRRFW